MARKPEPTGVVADLVAKRLQDPAWYERLRRNALYDWFLQRRFVEKVEVDGKDVEVVRRYTDEDLITFFASADHPDEIERAAADLARKIGHENHGAPVFLANFPTLREFNAVREALGLPAVDFATSSSEATLAAHRAHQAFETKQRAAKSPRLTPFK